MISNIEDYPDLFSPSRDVDHLITHVADLHFNKQKLEEENHRFKLALESSEEANSQLTEDCAELRLQVKR